MTPEYRNALMDMAEWVSSKRAEMAPHPIGNDWLDGKVAAYTLVLGHLVKSMDEK